MPVLISGTLECDLGMQTPLGTLNGLGIPDRIQLPYSVICERPNVVYSQTDLNRGLMREQLDGRSLPFNSLVIGYLKTSKYPKPGHHIHLSCFIGIVP